LQLSTGGTLETPGILCHNKNPSVFFEARTDQSMRSRTYLSFSSLSLFISLMFFCVSAPAQKPPAQQAPSKPINIDKELEEQVSPDRAVSYYHYSLAKWNEDQGDFPKALSEMQVALKYNPNSAPIHLAIAALLEKSGNIQEAIDHAKKAAQLDPSDPDPHWLLANIYFRPQLRGNSSADGIRELEKLKDLAPDDDRVYYALGSAYFELNQPEKAIQAFEKFQSLSTDIDVGYREIAKYYDRIGNPQLAAEYLVKGLAIQPDSMESLSLLGNIYFKLNKSKEAIPIYKKLMELSGENDAISQRLAFLFVETGEFEEAIKILAEISKDKPANPASQLYLGRAQIGAHKYAEAIDTLQSIAVPDAGIAMEAQYYLGIAYEEFGKYGEAIKIFSSLLKKIGSTPEDGNNNRLLFQQHLAANYWESGDREKAIGIYQEMAKANPKVSSQLIRAYRISRQFDKALPLGKDQLEKNPDNTQIGFEYALALAEAGKAKEGAEILANLLQSHPDEVELYVGLSIVYLEDKRYSDAEKILLRAEGKNFENGVDKERLKLQRAEVYEKQKDFDRAESLCKEILKENPSSAGALNYVGYMLADRGVRLDEAVKYVKEALAIEPRNGAYLDSLGWAFFKLNDMQNAEKYLLEADGLVKNDPTIFDHLGDLYYKTGNLDKAQSYWMKSVSIGTEQEDIQKVRRKLETLQEKLKKQKTGK
jgi:tetratricopeptide (TPR) repeat protein